MSSDLFRQTMRSFGAAVTVVTALDRGQCAGVTASAVCPVSLDPPTLLVCVNRAASVHDLILRSQAFCVNLLSDTQKELALRFSSPDPGVRAARFEGLKTRTLATGAPAIAGAVASFDCRVVRSTEYQSHTVFIGEVADILTCESQCEPGLPLMYVAQKFGRIVPLES